jgi:hypothetical protein
MSNKLGLKSIFDEIVLEAIVGDRLVSSQGTEQLDAKRG